MAHPPESGERWSLRSRFFVGSAPIEIPQINRAYGSFVWGIPIGAPHRTGRDGCALCLRLFQKLFLVLMVAADQIFIFPCMVAGCLFLALMVAAGQIFIFPCMVVGCFFGACSLSVAALTGGGRARPARCLSLSLSHRRYSSWRPSNL